MFGFGTNIKTGTYESDKPFYYDYYSDYQTVRWKAMDEAIG